MAYDTTQTKRHYATLVDESVRERDVLTSRCEPGWAQPTATRRLAYRTEGERALLLHALSQIPLALAEATSKDDLVRPQISADRDTLTFRFHARTGFDPLMYAYASGHYALVYSRRRASWYVSVLWSERTSESVHSVATGFETLGQCLDFVRAARSLGIVHWRAERADIAAKRVIKRLDDERAIDDIMDEIV